MMCETNGRAAIEAVDLLVWEVVTASGELAQGAECGLARLLREGAAGALAGVNAACRESCRRRGTERLAAGLEALRRLGTWLDLAERFGDLSAGRALLTLEAQGRALLAVGQLHAAWREEGADTPSNEQATIELVLPSAVGDGPRATDGA